VTDPEKQHRNDCSTCDEARCSDCTLETLSRWRQREDVAAQVVKPPMAPEDSQLRDCGTCEAVRCFDCTPKDHRGWSARYPHIRPPPTLNPSKPSPADYYDGEACMDACRLACRGRTGIEGHLVASAIQYLWRSGRKGPALPDLIKAKDMIDRLVRETRGGM
jgi:hypothetical protein